MFTKFAPIPRPNHSPNSVRIVHHCRPMARDRQVNICVVPTTAAIDEPVELARDFSTAYPVELLSR